MKYLIIVIVISLISMNCIYKADDSASFNKVEKSRKLYYDNKIINEYKTFYSPFVFSKRVKDIENIVDSIFLIAKNNEQVYIVESYSSAYILRGRIWSKSFSLYYQSKLIKSDNKSIIKFIEQDFEIVDSSEISKGFIQICKDVNDAWEISSQRAKRITSVSDGDFFMCNRIVNNVIETCSFYDYDYDSEYLFFEESIINGEPEANIHIKQEKDN